MKTVFSSHSQLAHVWANQLQSFGRANNMLFEGPSIYSYGKHYMIGHIHTMDNGQKIYFINRNGYSNSTSKHTNHVYRSIEDGMPVFDVPFVEFSGTDKTLSKFNYFTIENLPAIVAQLNIDMIDALNKQLRAKSSFYYFKYASDIENKILSICDLFNVSKPERPEIWEKAGIKADKLRIKYELNERIKERKREREREKRKEEQLENLNKWLNHEYNGTLYDLPVHLRLTKDGQHIQTTKGATVSLFAALRLVELLKNKQGLGEKVDGFTVTANNEQTVTIGCHLIEWSIIDNFLETIKITA